jgi:hypothetical protein
MNVTDNNDTIKNGTQQGKSHTVVRTDEKMFYNIGPTCVKSATVALVLPYSEERHAEECHS